MSFYAPLAEWSKWAWPLLANHLWQATLFFLFALAVSWSLNKAPARVRYSLWLLALTKFVLPCAALAALLKQAGFDATSIFTSESGGQASALAISPYLSPVASPHAVLHITKSILPGVGSSSITYAVTMQDQGNWYGVLALIWIVGCALLLGLWLRKISVLSSVIKSGKVVSRGREFEILQRVRMWLGLRRRVTLVISSEIAEPGVWSVFKPTVLLPEGISDRLNDRELETIMMHELVHVERWDNLIGIVQRVVCCLLWFHPLVWLLDRQLLAEREQSCDDTVIRLSGDSQIYASGIKKICRHSIGWELTGLSNVGGSNLKKRIKRIVEADIIRSPSVLHRMLLGTVIAALIVLSAAVGLINNGEIAAPGSNHVSTKIDPRFVVADSESREDVAFAVEDRIQKPPLLKFQGIPVQTKKFSDAPVEVRGKWSQIETTEPGILAEVSQFINEISPPQVKQGAQDAQASMISAAIIPASTNQVDLSEFVGRYEVDPKAAENFILDITLEHGELWLKPSHTSKRRLMRTAELSLSDNTSEFRFTCIQGKGGRIIGLRIDSWDSGITARKLLLPPPSLEGNTTFRLSGYPNARIVAVAGSFNNWNQSQFLFTRVDGEWICKINLPPGKYEYKFIVDGNWLVDPRNPKTKNDERGNENSVLVAE
jgi:beta-lactamase regulating signal transducer with metallopeptidase domain